MLYDLYLRLLSFYHVNKFKSFKTESDNSIIQYANAHWGEAAIEAIVKYAGVNINEVDKLGHSALHHAAMDGNEKNLKLLLRLGADINLATKDGQTALHEAIMFDQIGAVKILLNAGANVNQPNNDGWTALHEAAWQGDPATVELLSGADCNALSKSGETALDVTKKWNNLDAYKALMDSIGCVESQISNDASDLLCGADGVC